MQYFQSLAQFHQSCTDAVLVIGNFDGVHKGHQALIRKAKHIAATHKAKLGILTFEPHPRSLFKPDERTFRITPESMKKDRLSECGVDFVLSLPFDWDFASQSADDFIRTVLVETIKPVHIMTGYDFRFGQLRKGSAETLRQAGFAVSVENAVIAEDGHTIVSSSQIRQHIRHGEMDMANALLGWSWEINGQVKQGDQRGRALEYPTANMALDDVMHPAYGVYASWTRVDDEGEWHPSATNIGIRPMFEIDTAQVETFIFDFNRDIYGKRISVRPVQYLRGEAKFTDLNTLSEQIAKDCQKIREILALRPVAA